MLRLAEDLSTSRTARNAVNRSHQTLLDSSLTASCFRGTFVTGLALVAFLAPGLPASADTDLFDTRLPENLRYQQRFERKPPSISFRRNELRAVEAPTRYPTVSILKYSTPIGNTGLIFRVKARPNPRRLVKLEIRF